jgi:hypothetical protein
MYTKAKEWFLTGLVTVSLGLAVSPTFGQDQGQENDPPARVARIGAAQGSVSLMTAGSQDWSDAPANYPMISGDRIYTDQGARAEVQSGSTQVRLWGGTDLTMTNLTDNYEQIGLAQGSIRVRVYRMEQGGTVEVDTPNGAVVITRPGDYRVDAYQGDDGSDVVVNSGDVQITGPGVNQELEAGQAVRLNGSDQIQLTPVEVPGFDDLDNWSIQRDHHLLNSQSAQYVNHDMVGYDDLDDNGSWSQESDYGPVWYPRNVDPDWRPYSYGHWAYVQPWGYTWVDDASWGYAPFHYGRWVEVQNRWGWVPGPREVVPVYSPALVAFVGGPHFSIGVSVGGGGGVAAWFPLGVGEPYVPWYRCSPRYVRQVNVTNVNIVNVHNTTIVNNYNTFITNTRTVNNVNNIRVNNINYQHRNQVVAVSENDMSSGRRVNQAQVRLNPQQRQQLAQAPVHFTPSAPAPTRSALVPRQNVHAQVQRPVLMTPHGASRAVPSANPARAVPVNLPRPAPPSALAKPVAGATVRPGAPNGARPAVGVRPNAGPVATPTNRPAQPVGVTPNRPGVPANAQPGQPNRPGVPAAAQPGQPGQPNRPGVPPNAQPGQPNRPGTPANVQPGQPGQPNRPGVPANSQPGQQPNGQRPLITRTPPPQVQQQPNQPQRPVPNQPPVNRPPAQPQRPNTPPQQQTAPPQQQTAPPQQQTAPPQQQQRPVPPQQQRPYTPPPAQQPQRPVPNQPPVNRPPAQQERPYTPPPQTQRPAPPQQQQRPAPQQPTYRPPAQQERPYTPPQAARPAPPPQRPAPQVERPAPPPRPAPQQERQAPPPQHAAPPPQREAPPARQAPDKKKDEPR